MENYLEASKVEADAGLPPGIVIRDGFAPPARPSIAAFIWGGKTRPVPSLPYGRRSA